MRYVARDTSGNIRKVVTHPEDDATEGIFKENPELIGLLTEGGSHAALRAYLASSDAELLRVLEDLVNVLIGKGMLLLTDFPEPAQEKLMRRASVRETMASF